MKVSKTIYAIYNGVEINTQAIAYINQIDGVVHVRNITTDYASQREADDYNQDLDILLLKMAYKINWIDEYNK